MSVAGCAVASRHDLLDLHPDSWSRIVRLDAAMDAVPLLQGWVTRGFPVMRRRRLASDPPDAVPAAIALPAGAGPRRVGFSVPASSIRRSARPTLLSAAVRAAPTPWREPVQRLLAIGRRHGIAPRVFGSLMWQAVTGLDYLTDGSDLDLLWAVDDGTDLAGLLEGLAAVGARAAPRIDGEIVFASGEAVQWAELHAAVGQDQDRVLAKSLDAVRLVSIAELWRRQVA